MGDDIDSMTAAEIESRIQELQIDNEQLRRDNARLRKGQEMPELGDLAPELERVDQELQHTREFLRVFHTDFVEQTAALEQRIKQVNSCVDSRVQLSQESIQRSLEQSVAQLRKIHEGEEKECRKLLSEATSEIENVKKGMQEGRPLPAPSSVSTNFSEALRKVTASLETEGRVAGIVSKAHTVKNLGPELPLVKQEVKNLFTVRSRETKAELQATLGSQQDQQRLMLDAALKRTLEKVDEVAKEVSEGSRETAAAAAARAIPGEADLTAKFQEEAAKELARAKAKMLETMSTMWQRPVDSVVDQATRRRQWQALIARDDGKIWSELGNILRRKAGEGPGVEGEVRRNVEWLLAAAPRPQPVPPDVQTAPKMNYALGTFADTVLRGTCLSDPLLQTRLEYVVCVCDALNPTHMLENDDIRDLLARAQATLAAVPGLAEAKAAVDARNAMTRAEMRFQSAKHHT